MDGAPPSYLPNNPSFLQDPWKSPQSFSPISHAAFDEAAEDKSCGEPQDFDCPRSPGVDLNINSFSFSPVDMEPLTSLFSFSTCSSPYKAVSSSCIVKECLGKAATRFPRTFHTAISDRINVLVTPYSGQAASKSSLQQDEFFNTEC
ncbi:hypothetical protein AVEN_61049-1 [Araneus ventricosus]|uniref:Uncharacterized protein n=1 Tax=Araneus ventricosus TaxID=182803 RepID=A0A4Y2DWY2_ARAVE|nr:hypothetical protein AVEN_61049-1 [Araneus ventricosus]